MRSSSSRTSIWDLHESQGPIGLQLNNRLVPLARQRIERAKASGSPTKKVRPGLVIPTDWNSHYIRVHNSELPWFVSGVMQNSILGNALAGEKKRWKSPGGASIAAWAVSACLLVALGSAIAVPSALQLSADLPYDPSRPIYEDQSDPSYVWIAGIVVGVVLVVGLDCCPSRDNCKGYSRRWSKFSPGTKLSTAVTLKRSVACGVLTHGTLRGVRPLENGAHRCARSLTCSDQHVMHGEGSQSGVLVAEP